jgi:polyferredoxin
MKIKSSLLRTTVLLAIVLAITLFAFKFVGKSSAFNPESLCPFGGMQALSSFIVTDTLACDMTTVQIALGVLLLLSAFLIGKLFCAFLCPVGFVNELLGRGRKALKIKEVIIKDGSIADTLLRSVKYILLFIIFYFSVTSSELFCKQFDPYYASATGFTGEINLWLSMAAFYLLIFGSYFIQMFWCRYICPLGASLNNSRFLLFSAALILLYWLVSFIGLDLEWYYLAGVIILAGYLLEVFCRRGSLFPLVKIRREEQNCPEGCEICAKKCPYNIPVNRVDSVKHIDCTLCCDCISACPNNALTINGKRGVWIAVPFVALLLVVAGVVIGNRWEMPAVDLKWGAYEKLETETVEIGGLRSVKCYGSSVNFAKRIESIPGIYGVKTYVKDHRVRILYNPDEILASEVEEAIYNPVKFKISQPGKEVEKIKVLTVYTENMTDPLDVNYLGMQFRKIDKGYYALESEFSKPLTLKFYMDINEEIDYEFLKGQIEKREMEIMLHGGKTKTEKVNFNVHSFSEVLDTISKRKMLEHFFKSYKSIFNDSISKEKIMTFDIVYPGIEKPLIARQLPLLAGYLLLQEGVKGIETILNSEDIPTIRIYYHNDKTSPELIRTALTQPKWKKREPDGTIKEFNPQLNFK